MTDRRKFIREAGLLAAGTLLTPAFMKGMAEASQKIASMPPEQAASDEDFWSWVRENYTVATEILNLNNGGVSPQPRPVQEVHEKYLRMCNSGPSYYMWRILDQGREPLRTKLADLAGCDPEEIAINRNTTEALNTIIFGLNLKAGDEIILTKQDYPNMMNAWKQRELRDGIKLVYLNLELPPEDDKAIIKKYSDAMTDKTRLVHITHMINWTGQIMPVKEIAKAAHAKGIDVMVDGAHTFAHIDYSISDLGCDYFGTSLHKWLCAPFGTGFLFIKKEKIKDIWTLLGNDHTDFVEKQKIETDIRKFENLGTRSFPAEMAVDAAIDFHLAIGSKRKEERLRYLRNYWVNQVKDIPGVTINTPLKPGTSCAIANFSIANKKTEDVDTVLWKYKIHTVGINRENIHGTRVTPHVYTSVKDLDRLIKAIKEAAVA